MIHMFKSRQVPMQSGKTTNLAGLSFCGDDFYFAFRDGGQEFGAAGFSYYSAVQDDHDAGVGFTAKGVQLVSFMIG